MTPTARCAVISRARLQLVSATAVAAVVGAWFVAGELKLVDPLFLPGPIEVLTTAGQLLSEGYRQISLWEHILVSVARAMVAFLVAALTGIPIGLMMGRSPLFNAILDPIDKNAHCRGVVQGRY